MMRGDQRRIDHRNARTIRTMLQRGMTHGQLELAEAAHNRRERIRSHFIEQLVGCPSNQPATFNLSVASRGGQVEGDLGSVTTCFGQIDFSELRTLALFDAAGGEDDEESDASENEDNANDDDEDAEDAEDDEADDGDEGHHAQGVLGKHSQFVLTPCWTQQNMHTSLGDGPDLLWVLEQHWEIQRPGCIFSIAGGQRTDVHPILGQILTRGLNMAVDQTDGWVRATEPARL